MKNVILIDINSYALESLLQLEDVYIAALAIETEEMAQPALKKYPGRIGNVYHRIIQSDQDFQELHKSDYFLTYEEIEKYRNVQLKIEHFISREVLDYNEAQYRYYSVLQYWLGIFNKYRIDAVIFMNQEHGGIWDSIPLEIAKQNNIKILGQDVILGNCDIASYSYRCFNNNHIINIANITDKYNNVNIENYLYNKRALTFNDKGKFKFNLNSIKEYWEDSLINLFLNYIKYELTLKLKSTSERFYTKNKEYQIWYNMTPKELFFNNKYIRDLAKTYSKISYKPEHLDDKKYIFYGLHFDPEAMTMARATISNQLYIIKMLSEALPEGWMLYVKEHPYQFKARGSDRYLLKNIFYFRTERFYKRILSFKNVKLLSLDLSTKELIENSQAASTIAGTIALESVIANKPVILFGGDISTLGRLNDIFTVKSKQDVVNAMSKIKTGFQPDYNDLEKLLSEYAVECPTQPFFIQPEVKNYLVDLFTYFLEQYNI